MTIKEFIEAAIKGGWDLNGLKGQMNYGWEWKLSSFSMQKEYLECWDDIGNVFPLDTNEMFLDPEAWKAVGKAKEWGTENWKYNMLYMIIDLQKGKSLLEYIATL